MLIYNTLTRKKEEFIPQVEGKVTIYTCGPTVYSEPHIGNWVAYLRWDMLVRTLRAEGYDVHRVMNITDVGHLVSDADEGEDKMEKGARREGKTAWEIAEYYSERFLDGMAILGLLPAEQLARATDFIPQQLALAKTLKDKGYTYETSDGIYFDTAKFPSYADFARLDLEGLREGARVEATSEKRNPSDFAVWKFSPEGQKRDMEWYTPYDLLDRDQEEQQPHTPLEHDGQATLKKPGFPGWHLECSAIAMNFLGETLDIHTGGIDHIPVHHTNEIAQSEAATGKRFANFWMHCDHLLSGGKKLSKSLSNSYTLDELAIKGFSPMDFRMFILQSHYRTETNFTFDNLTAAAARLKRWKSIAALRWQTNDTTVEDEAKAESDLTNKLLAAPHAIRAALSNDLSTPSALVAAEAAFDALEAVPLSSISHEALLVFLETVDELFGLNLLGTTPDLTDDEKQLLVERERARESKNWERSDEIRTIFSEKGIALKDNGDSATWMYS